MNKSDNNPTEKKIFVVLGMARSGTSVIARALQTLNINLGNNLLKADRKWNAKGFWEDGDIVYKINRGLLYTLQNTGVELVQYDDLRNNASIQKLKKNASNILQNKMTNTLNWGFKDPRTAIMLPFWQDVFTELQLIDYYVIALRNPLASAYSYQRVKGVDVELGLFLWLTHLFSAIDHTNKKKRVIVNYDLLLKDPKMQVGRIKTQLSIDTCKDNDMDYFSAEFIDQTLNHYEYTLADLISHPATAVVPLCIKVYELLMKVAKDQVSLDSDDFSCSWLEIKKEFSYLYPIYCYMNNLIKKNKEHRRKIDSINRSLPWKLIFPLRLLDDLLRDMRIKIREKRRMKRFYE